MLIDPDLVSFCAKRTQEVATRHDESCGAKEGEPRSAEDLHWIMAGLHGFPIYHKVIDKNPWTEAKYRSFYIPYGERDSLKPEAVKSPAEIKECWIFYASGMPNPHLRYYKTKELLQIHLWQESMATADIVDLVQNMILRASPTSLDLNLGHSTTSDTLGEIAAMEFLFPLKRRLAYLAAGNTGNNGLAKLAAQYDIPPFIVQQSLVYAPVLEEYFV